MATISYWNNVTIDVQSAIASGKTVTAIQKTNPAVVTHDGTAYTDGDYVLLEVSGMAQMNNRVVRADAISASPTEFQAEELDASNFSTFTSGTAKLITFGTTMSTVLGVTPAGGDPEFEDITTVHDAQRLQTITLTSPFTVTFESFWDPADTALISLKTAADTKAARAVRIGFASGAKLAFYADVGFAFLPGGTTPGKVTTSITLSSKGLSSAWST